MRTAIILLSILLLFWIAGSSYVYVCKIRKDCCVEATAEVDSAAIKQAIADSLEAAAAAIPAVPVPPMHCIYFDFNKSAVKLTAENTAHVELLKQYLAAEPGKKIMVTGHSDATGPAWAKQMVSEQRADFIKTKLTEAGIEPNTIETAAESDHKPATDNSTSEGRAKNRRAEIIIQ
ncbi:MAG: OmpA family protein [Bacteroidales bacterium]|nr:OmpA family protein [Bacteroidales bacterium]